jgi:hypothetical protein
MGRVESIKSGLPIAAGFRPEELKAIRYKLNQSQAEFALHIGHVFVHAFETVSEIFLEFIIPLLPVLFLHLSLRGLDRTSHELKRREFL